MKKIDWRGHAAMFGANTIWGLMSPIVKLVMAGGIITPILLTHLRVVGAMILFWIVSFFQKREHVSTTDLLKLFAASLLAIVFNQGCFVFGVGLTSPADASIITTSMPLWAMILAAIFLHEPITGRKVLGIAAGASGAVLLILGNSPSGASISGSDAIIGDLLVLGAQLSYASYLVLFKHFVSRYSLVTTMKWMFTFATLCILPFSAKSYYTAEWASLSTGDIVSVAFIVVGATFVSYLLVTIGMRLLRPTVAGMYNYVQPVLACALTVAMGMDHFTAVKAFAIALICSGVFLVTSSKSRADELAAAEAEK